MAVIKQVLNIWIQEKDNQIKFKILNLRELLNYKIKMQLNIKIIY